MHARMLPSKPKALPSWTTKSLKYGFSPRDVQRSSIVHPAGPCATATRRLGIPPIAPAPGRGAPPPPAEEKRGGRALAPPPPRAEPAQIPGGRLVSGEPAGSCDD